MEHVVLIPEELNRPEYYGRFFSAMGYGDEPQSPVEAWPVGDKVLLLRNVPQGQPHPLAVSLSQPETGGNLLQVDLSGETANYTLHSNGKLLFADILPAVDEASVLLAVNRIVVAHKLGAVRIVCSGEGCQRMQTTLARHFRNVGVHPDGENRNRHFVVR